MEELERQEELNALQPIHFCKFDPCQAWVAIQLVAKPLRDSLTFVAIVALNNGVRESPVVPLFPK